jgi:hypothetical protein
MWLVIVILNGTDIQTFSDHWEADWLGQYYRKSKAFILLFWRGPVLGLEPRASFLLDRLYTTWDTLSALYALGIFWTGTQVYARTNLDSNAPSYLRSLQSRDDRYETLHPAFIGWDGVLLTFCPGWPQSITSQVARTRGMNQCAWLILTILGREFWKSTSFKSKAVSLILWKHSCDYWNTIIWEYN